MNRTASPFQMAVKLPKSNYIFNAMKISVIIALLAISGNAFGQKGYIFLKNGKRFDGYIKQYKPFNSNEKIIEYWRDKKDKNPIQFQLSEIHSYSIDEKVRRIISDFKPFYNREIYFNLTEADIITTGKITLLSIPINNIEYSPSIYVIEDSLEYLTAIPNTKELFNVLKQFIPEDNIIRHIAYNYGSFSYAEIPSLIYGFNNEEYVIRNRPDRMILIQTEMLIAHSSKLFGNKIEEINNKPDIIFSDIWQKIPYVESLTDTLVHQLHAFKILTGAITFGTDKNENIILIQFHPNKILSFKEMESFLSIRYKNKSLESEGSKLYIVKSENYEYGFWAEKSNCCAILNIIKRNSF